MFLQTVKEEDATGRIAELYAQERSHRGFVPESAQCFTTRPDLLPAFTEFFETVQSGFCLGSREWRLITLIAAKHVPSTYCSSVYGKDLTAVLGSKEAVLAIRRDYRSAGLSEKEVAMLAYAEKISRNASEVTEADIDGLRAVGFSDREICDIALCASFRAFISRFVDAVGARPEPYFIDSDPAFRAEMTGGKGY